MNCNESLEYLSAAADGQLEEEKRKEFDAHILKCPSCRSEFERETITKRTVTGKLRRERAPAGVRDRILQELYSESAVGGIGRGGVKEFIDRLFARPLARPALVLGTVVLLAAVGITLLSRREASPPVSENTASDMVDQAVEHYSSYLGGGARLQLISSNHEQLRNFFQDKVSFDIYVPEMQNCELIGGVLCEHDGAKFLHFVYKKNEKVLYFSMACSKELKAKSKIGLSAKAQSDLKENGWFFDTSRRDCNVAVWKEKDEICSVVADMGKEELLALLKE